MYCNLPLKSNLHKMLLKCFYAVLFRRYITDFIIPGDSKIGTSSTLSQSKMNKDKKM